MKDEKKEKIQSEIKKYEDFYNKAFLKLKNAPDELEFSEILSAAIISQEQYSSQARDIRNIFFINSFRKSNLIAYDQMLPDKINLIEYYILFKKPNAEFFEESEIFKDDEQLKRVYIAFVNRFFKGGVDDFNFFDKIIINTLIKSKILVRYDSALEDITSTAKTFFNSLSI